MLLNPRKSSTKAFTLLELIVVIVILGLLAALAIPTFARVTKRSQDASTSATISAVLRDARALMAFQDTTTWDAATATAVGETSAPSAAGLSAAAMSARQAATASSTDAEPASTAEAVYAILEGGVVVSMLSKSGNLCVASTSLTSATTPKCLPVLPSGKSSALAASRGSSLSDGSVLPLPPGATTASSGPTSAPSAPTSLAVYDVTATSASVSWNASAATTSAVTGYVVTATPASGSPVTGVMAGATSASLSGLTPGTTYVVTVKATSAAGDSSPGSVNLSTLSREAYYRPTVLADSPVLYYGLDEASGTTAAALAGPSGTYSSGRATTAGKVGAGSLGSAVGSVTAGSRPFAAADASAFSVEAWAKATAPGTFRYVVGDADWTGTKGFAFYTGSTGGLQFAVATTSGKALASVPAAGVWDGTWHHIVGTFASGTARLYVDGALVSTASVAAGAKMLAPSTQDVTIGRFSGTEDTLYFNGSIDEAAVYTTELSAGRVSAHFLAGK